MIACKENTEAVLLAQWLTANGYLYTHIANELMHWCPPAIRALAKRMGLHAGIPDYIIVLKRYQVVFLELKRLRGGKVSDDQQKWLDRLRMCGQIVIVAQGAQHAIAQLLEAEQHGKW